MNLLTQHLSVPFETGLELPSHRFVTERTRAEVRLGSKLCKFFCDEPAQAAPCRAEIDALLADNLRLRAGVEEARVALAKAYGDE